VFAWVLLLLLLLVLLLRDARHFSKERFVI